MGTEPVIFEISSDEDEDWLSDLLDRVNEESDSFDDVVVVDEKVACAPAIQKHKFLPSNGMKGSGSDSDDDCLILDGDPDKPITAVDDTGNGTDDLLIVGEKGQVFILLLSSFLPTCLYYGFYFVLCLGFVFGQNMVVCVLTHFGECLNGWDEY